MQIFIIFSQRCYSEDAWNEELVNESQAYLISKTMRKISYYSLLQKPEQQNVSVSSH